MRRFSNQLTDWMAAWWPMLVVSFPIMFAAVRAAAGGWVPIGDDAYFTVRSRDVLTEHHPLLGAWSSGSLDLSTPINNLGPLQLDLLAPFTRWTPMGGTAVGVAVVNVASIAAIAWMVRRLAGPAAVLPAMLVVALLTWTMGSEMLITPRQHQYSIVPYLCLLVAAWAVATGDRWAVVVAVAAASLVAQTHLSYPLLVAALVAVMVAGQAISTRAGSAVGGRRPLVIAGALAVVLWSQTIVDQFTGDHNLGHVLFGSGDAGRAGMGTGSRIVAGALVSLDMLLRPGYRQFDAEARMASTWQSIVLWLALAASMAAVVVAARRHGWNCVAGAVVAIVAVLAGVVDAALLPQTKFGYTIANYRWLWSTGAFIVLVAVVALMTLMTTRRRSDETRTTSSRKPLLGAATLAVMVLAVANLPRSVQLQSADRYLDEQANVARLLDQLDTALDRGVVRGPVVVDDAAMYFGHGFTYPLLVELQQHDVEFRFEEAIQERRFGSGRISDGTETQRLRLLANDLAVDARTSPGVIGFVDAEQPVALVVESV